MINILLLVLIAAILGWKFSPPEKYTGDNFNKWVTSTVIMVLGGLVVLGIGVDEYEQAKRIYGTEYIERMTVDTTHFNKEHVPLIQELGKQPYIIREIKNNEELLKLYKPSLLALASLGINLQEHINVDDSVPHYPHDAIYTTFITKVLQGIENQALLK